MEFDRLDRASEKELLPPEPFDFQTESRLPL